MQRWIMHVDMDAFYAAVEQRDHPQLRGRPVVVGALPGGRGVVATCSYEARRFGVRSAMPISEAWRRCPDAVYLRPRMDHYAAVSRQVRRVLEGISPVVEPVSIDEAFVDVSGQERLVGPPEVVGRRVKEEIRRAVGLTASVGIGPNRLIAKLASDFDKPDGLTLVPPERVAGFLAPQPVSVLRGVGPKMQLVLQRLGLKTVADLRELPLEGLQRHLGAKAAVSLYQQARGIASDRVGNADARKSLSKETTFAHDVTDRTLLRDTLSRLATSVARGARAEGLTGRVVTLKVRFQGFETHTRQRRLARGTDEEGVLLEVAWHLYERPGLPGRPVRLIGVGLSALGPTEGRQLDLFGSRTPASQENGGLSHTLDRINERFGAGTLRRGWSRREKTKDPG